MSICSVRRLVCRMFTVMQQRRRRWSTGAHDRHGTHQQDDQHQRQQEPSGALPAPPGPPRSPHSVSTQKRPQSATGQNRRGSHRKHRSVGPSAPHGRRLRVARAGPQHRQYDKRQRDGGDQAGVKEPDTLASANAISSAAAGAVSSDNPQFAQVQSRGSASGSDSTKPQRGSAPAPNLAPWRG